MDKIAKAIGAAQGGATSAMAVVACGAAIVQLLPANVVIPWWGYLLCVLLALLVCMLPPFLGAYLAPTNAPTNPTTVPVQVAVAAEAKKDGTVQVSAQPADAP